MKIKNFIIDVDGVLTDGSLYYYKEGEALKKFNVRDGQGIKLAEAYDLEIVVISGRESEIVKSRCEELGIKHIYQNTHDKAKKVREICETMHILLGEVAVVGDDILDVPAFEIVGLPVCPKDAHPSAVKRAKLVTEKGGGEGCVRELIDLILKEKGKIII
jgi:3-deoxy-D-manno-octulosonate 8-phosphate phosphatase (KDO 8-P phosphatase)